MNELLFAQSLRARRVRRKLCLLGTRLRISSVTRHPVKFICRMINDETKKFKQLCSSTQILERTVETSYAFFVEIFENGVVLKIEIVGYGGGGETSEEHVEFDAVEFDFDDRHESVLDDQQFGNFGLTLEQLGERGEKIGSLDVPRRYAQRVDVAALRVHAEPKRAERAHFAAHFLVLGHVLEIHRHVLDPVGVERVDLVQDVHAMPKLGVGLEHAVSAQRLFELGGEFAIALSGRIGVERQRDTIRTIH